MLFRALFLTSILTFALWLVLVRPITDAAQSISYNPAQLLKASR